MGYASLFLDRYDDAFSRLHRSLAANLGAGARVPQQSLCGNCCRSCPRRSNGGGAVERSGSRQARSDGNRAKLLPIQHHEPSVYAAQVARMRDGMRLAGIRDHADEVRRFRSAVGTDILHTDYEAATPTTRARSTDHSSAGPGPAPAAEHARWCWICFTEGGRLPGAIALWGAGIERQHVRRVTGTGWRGRYSELTRAETEACRSWPV